jgi:hypothetical protein
MVRQKTSTADTVKANPNLVKFPQISASIILTEALSDQFFGPPPVVVLRPMSNPSRYFNSSPEVIRLIVMMYVRHPLSLRNLEDLLAERGIDISHETVRFWWNRFGHVRGGDRRKAGHAHARHHRMALAFG